MLSKLIDGQTIRIDNHHRGSILNSLQGVHIHKIMNNDKFRGAEMLIPIGTDDKDDIDFRKLKGGMDVEKRLKNEIRKAFCDKAIRKKFIRSFYSSLDDMMRYMKVEDVQERHSIAKGSALRIAELFEVKPKVKESFIEEVNSFYKFTTDESDFYVVQYPKSNSIIVGTDLEIIRELAK